MKTIKAVVRFDSDAELARIGTRGFASVNTRTLMFQGEGMSIDVLMQDAGSMKIMHGQAVRIPVGAPVDDAAVIAGDNEAQTDRMGQFVLSLMDSHHECFYVRRGDVQLVCEIPQAPVLP